jgi:hypothetical protein
MLVVTASLWWAGRAPAESPRAPDVRQVPLSEARSARVLAHGEPLYFEPDVHAPRRGAASRGAQLPIYGSRHRSGCKQAWLLVGPEAWVCSERIELSRAAPAPARAEPERHPDGLPLDYYFVGQDGSFGYGALAQADVGVPDAELQPGFAIGVIDVAHQQGESYGLTPKGLWLPMRDLRPARPSSLLGIELREGDTALGWTYTDTAPLYDRPGGRRLPNEHLTRQTLVRFLESAEQGGRHWFRVGTGRWLRDEDVRSMTLADPPAEIDDGERWIDVDLASQTIVARVGQRPVYATLVSTGKGRGTDPQATPRGAHRIWVKLRTSDMTNLEDTEASRYYAMEEVPWVMYFDRGYGLHGAYWHDSFGNVRSHGCVNLAPRDAEWFFHWAGPHLPEGWRAVLPTEYDPGTLVRVR